MAEFEVDPNKLVGLAADMAGIHGEASGSALGAHSEGRLMQGAAFEGIYHPAVEAALSDFSTASARTTDGLMTKLEGLTGKLSSAASEYMGTEENAARSMQGERVAGVSGPGGAGDGAESGPAGTPEQRDQLRSWTQKFARNAQWAKALGVDSRSDPFVERVRDYFDRHIMGGEPTSDPTRPAGDEFRSMVKGLRPEQRDELFSRMTPDERRAWVDSRPDPFVERVRDYFDRHIMGGEPTSDPTRPAEDEFRSMVKGLRPEQRDELFSRMTPDELRAWDDKLQGMPRRAVLDHGTDVLANVRPETASRVASHVSSLQPEFSTKGGPVRTVWRSTSDLPRWSRLGRPQPDDVRQGFVRDCKVSATLSSAAEQQPDVLVNAIRANPNGTYTVTLHSPEDGSPVRVTVTDEAPAAIDHGMKYAAARPGVDGAKWPMIVEKAYAQLRGGYGQMEPLPASQFILTGDASTIELFEMSNPSLDRVANLLQDGSIVTTASKNDDALLEPRNLVANHTYVVTGVDPTSGTVTLRNPWGPESAAPYEVTLTHEEWLRYFQGYEYTPLR